MGRSAPESALICAAKAPGSVRLVHLSDTHLGFADYGRVDSESGVNRREEDIYRVFEEVVDYAVRTRPDLVIHAGDLFDSVRPSNRAIKVAMEQLSRLSGERIPTVVIAGNHSTPRLRSTVSVFGMLQYFPHIHPVFGGRYERLRIGDCTVHAIPHTYSEEDLQESIGLLRPDAGSKFNVMVAHAVVSGIQEASWGEFKDQILPMRSLKSGFDYIALGHYHKYLKVRDNAYYCGAPERFRFKEAGYTSGFLDVRLDPLSVRHVRTGVRDMVSFEPIDCRDLSASEIADELEAVVSGGVEGKIIRVVLDNIPRHVRSALDLKRIRQAVSGSLHCEFEYNHVTDGGRAASSQIGSVGEEFENYVRNMELDRDAAEKILALGHGYLADVEERMA